MESFVAHFGYVAVVVGVLLEGEAVLIAAGALAHRGLLSLPWVILAAFVSSVASDQVWFHVGRRFGSARVRRRLEVVKRWVARYGALYVVGFRFLYGLRTVSPIVLGAMKYPARRFTVLNAVGALVWAVAIGCLGYALGATFELLLKRAARIEEVALAAIGLAAVAALATRAAHFRRSRATSHAA